MRAKLLQPGQGRLGKVDDDDVQERGGWARADQGARVQIQVYFDRARDRRSKNIGNKGEMMLMKQSRKKKKKKKKSESPVAGVLRKGGR